MPSFCKRCSLHIPDGISTCRMCGSSVLAAPPPPTDGTFFSDEPGKVSKPGFSKWLFFIGLSLIVAPLTRILAIVHVEIPALFDQSSSARLAQHPGLDKLICFEIGMDVVLVMSALALNILFYRRNRYFPKSMLAYIVVILAYRIAVTGATHALFPDVLMIHSAYSLVRYLGWVGAMAACLLFDSDVETRFQN